MSSDGSKKMRKDTAGDSLNWRYQDKNYNELFKKWRMQSKDSMGFYYAGNPNELTYRDGYGFVKNYPEAVESKALRNVSGLIGITMLLVSILDIMSYYVIPPLLARFGVNIYYDFFANQYFGSDWAIIALKSTVGILRRLLPLLYCYKRLNMPFKVMMPVKVTNKPLFKSAVPMMLAVVGICTIMSFFGSELLGLIHIEQEEWVWLPKSGAALAVFLVIEIVIIPLISEFYTRGAVMQLMRQFGDGAAILFTAALSAITTYNIHYFGYVFVCAVVIGYFTVRTGSVITGALMRSTSRFVTYGICIANAYLDESISSVITAAILFLSIMIGLVSSVAFMIKHSDSFGMKFQERYLAFSERCMTAGTSVPVIVSLTVIFIMTVLRINIRI